MDVDGEHHNIDVTMLVLQQTQALSDTQNHIIDQQERLVRGQLDIQQVLATSPRRRKRSNPHSSPSSNNDPQPDDADDEGDDSSEEDAPKEKLPSRFHVMSSLSNATRRG